MSAMEAANQMITSCISGFYYLKTEKTDLKFYFCLFCIITRATLRVIESFWVGWYNPTFFIKTFKIKPIT